MTIALLFVTGVFGAAYYFLAIRDDVIRQAQRGPERPLRADDDNFQPPPR